MIVAKKNAAYYLSFPAIDSTTPASYKTGLSPVDTAYYKDGAGAWTSLAITDAASEIGSTGVYEIDLTAAELNHDKVIIKFSASGMADDAYEFDLRTKLTDDLNDLAATAIVSDGNALNTTSGALDLVTTTTTATTATTLTNLPAITANWLTAAGTAADFTTEIQTGLATAAALTTVDTVVDGIQADLSNATDGLGAIKAETALILADTGELQTDWADGGRLDLIQDIIAVDTTTDIPALIATAQADLDIITGASGVNLLTATQASIDAIETDTTTDIPALIAALNDLAASEILTTALTESYAADGAAPTLAQAIFLIQQFLSERAVAGTTTTVKKLDGSTTAATFTLNDGTSPTSITRAT